MMILQQEKSPWILKRVSSVTYLTNSSIDQEVTCFVEAKTGNPVLKFPNNVWIRFNWAELMEIMVSKGKLDESILFEGTHNEFFEYSLEQTATIELCTGLFLTDYTLTYDSPKGYATSDLTKANFTFGVEAVEWSLAIAMQLHKELGMGSINIINREDKTNG